MDLSESIIGVWELLSREDWTRDQQKRIDPILGSNPIAILAYSKSHFTAQFMKRDRSSSDMQANLTGANNTAAVGGYDAYFGTYQINEDGKVSHTLTGSINPANIGMTVLRNLKVENDQLTIQLETNTIEGEPITRTLLWQRLR